MGSYLVEKELSRRGTPFNEEHSWRDLSMMLYFMHISRV